MRIAIASDHGGYELKEEIKKFLEKRYEFKDFGCKSKDSCDYPDFGFKAAEAVSKGHFDRGIVICTTGLGMSITANKVKGVRAALCYVPEAAEKSRQHNDANVLALGAKFCDPLTARLIIKTWFDTDFEGGRHKRRVDKITTYESNN